MTTEDRIKLFGMSTAHLERDLDKVETALGLDLQRARADEKDEDYYPQFDHGLRVEAAPLLSH